ncbi:ketopantoate reductase PanE/ApbA-domain-containing protein, partial [Coniella lustricola]
DKRVFILGLGNLGKLYATCLAQLSRPPPITLVVHRRSLLEQWAANPGIEMTRHGTTHRFEADLDLEWWTTQRPTIGPVREAGVRVDGGDPCGGGHIANLIVATKAAQALPEVDKLRRYLDASSSILFVQNGMSRLWPPHGPTYCAWRWPDGNHPTFLHGITTHGVYTEGPFKSVHAAPADVVIGTVCPRTQHHHQEDTSSDDDGASHLIKLITNAPHLAGRSVSRRELWVLQLEKLVVNTIINPLTALLRVRNGELFTFAGQPSTKDTRMIAKIMDKLLVETSACLQALIQHESSHEILVTHQDSSSSSSSLQIRALLDRFSVPKLHELLYTVGAKVKYNKSSMLQDVEAGKPTEVREFNGWLVDTGAVVLGEEASQQQLAGHRLLIELVEKGAVLSEEALGK